MKRLILLVTSLFMLAAPATALAAFNPLENACKAGDGSGSSSTACSADGTTDPISGPNGALRKATLIIASVAGIVAVIIILVSGLQFVLANGDAQKVSQARTAIISAVVGLVVIAVSTSLILFVVSKL